jgi:hypothetical protein
MRRTAATSERPVEVPTAASFDPNRAATIASAPSTPGDVLVSAAPEHL